MIFIDSESSELPLQLSSIPLFDLTTFSTTFLGFTVFIEGQKITFLAICQKGASYAVSEWPIFVARYQGYKNVLFRFHNTRPNLVKNGHLYRYPKSIFRDYHIQTLLKHSISVYIAWKHIYRCKNIWKIDSLCYFLILKFSRLFMDFFSKKWRFLSFLSG